MNAKKIGMKAFVLILALVLLIGCVAGGTIAYLMTESDTVTNTFVAGNIGTLELEETCANEFVVVPGHDIAKDPTVSFSGNNVAAYVFLEVNAAGWAYATVEGKPVYYLGDAYGTEGGKRVEAFIADGWTPVEGKSNVFYREVAVNNTNTPAEFEVIKGDCIEVSETITMYDINEFITDYNEATGSNLTIENFRTSLTFKAYAIQKQKAVNTDFTPAEAWAQFGS